MGTTRIWRRAVAGGALALGLATASIATAPAASAGTRVTGTVMCVSQVDVVGIWIQAERGGSGWASRSTVNGQRHHQRYSFTLPRGGRYQVHVGCGGTPSRWGSNNKSAYVSGNRNFLCLDPWSGARPPYRGTCRVA